MTALERADGKSGHVMTRLRNAKARALQDDKPNTVAEINAAMDHVTALRRELTLALVAEDNLRNAVQAFANLLEYTNE